MSLAEEMLATMSASDDISTYFAEEEPHIVINDSRQAIVPNELKTIAVTGDKDIETVTFDCVRNWDGNDLSTFAIYLNYVLPDLSTGTYIPSSIVADGNVFHFDWDIKNNITKKSGKIAFAITAIKTKKNDSGETVVDKQWSSIPNGDCSIALGIDISNVPSEEESSDVLAQMSAILEQLQQDIYEWFQNNLPISQTTGDSENAVMSQKATTAELNAISKSAGIEKTMLLNFATGVTTRAFSGLFILYKRKARGNLHSVSFKTQKVGTYEVDLSIWQLINGVFTRIDTQTFTGEIVSGEFTLYPNFSSNEDYYIGFYSTDDIYGYSTWQNEIAAVTDRYAETMPYDGYASAFLPMCEIFVTHFNPNGTNNIECHVGKGYKYSQIQEALDDNENADCLTIYLHPSDTPYKRFSTMRKLNAPYPWDGIYCKRISIIGLDKYKCNVLDDSGNYNTPPAEICCNGFIENITFTARHIASTGVETTGSFAVHVDNRPKDKNGMLLTFRNCDFISYQTAAVGLGVYKNQSIGFENCNFKSYTDPTWKPNAKYDSEYMCSIGAYYMHTSMGREHGNMGVSFHNCFLYHDGGAYAMRIHETEGYPTMWLGCINNILHTTDGSAKCQFDGSTTYKQPYNFGNNAEELNA